MGVCNMQCDGLRLEIINNKSTIMIYIIKCYYFMNISVASANEDTHTAFICIETANQQYALLNVL